MQRRDLTNITKKRYEIAAVTCLTAPSLVTKLNLSLLTWNCKFYGNQRGLLPSMVFRIDLRFLLHTAFFLLCPGKYPGFFFALAKYNLKETGTQDSKL